jgi:hypothetical protein
MLHYFFLDRRVRFTVLSLALAVMLAACGGEQPPTIDPDNTVSITHTEGTAMLVRATSAGDVSLPTSYLLAQGDQIYTSPDQSATLQFPDGSTLRGPDSHILLFAIRPSDHAAIFRLLSGSTVGDLRSKAIELQAYEELAISFRMVQTDLTAVPHSDTGTYQLGFDGDVLKAVVSAGEFDMRSGNQQATLPSGWQASVEPGKSLQVASLITPTPAPPDIEVATATPIQIIVITPTRTPTEIPLVTDTATATRTPTRTPTRTQPTIIAGTPTVAPTIIINTPVPPATEKPNREPKPPPPPPPPPPEPPEPPPPPPEPPEPPPPTREP